MFNGGAFTYIQDRPASFYISQAGGIDPERSGKGQYWVLDEKGTRRQETDALMPGDRIYVPINNFTYNFIRYSPVISGLVTMVIVVVPFIEGLIAGIR